MFNSKRPGLRICGNSNLKFLVEIILSMYGAGLEKRTILIHVFLYFDNTMYSII